MGKRIECKETIELPFRTTRGNIRKISLGVKSILKKNFQWAVQSIKYVETYSGWQKPIVWFPGTFGIECEVLHMEDTRLVLRSGTIVFELVK